MAYWIWLDDKKYPQFSNNKRESVFSVNKDGFCMAEFIKEYSVKGTAKIKICADARYELYVNEKFLGRGPASPGSDFLTEKMNYCYYDEYEITDTSSVKIRAVVASQATAINEFTFGHPGLYVEISDTTGYIGGTDGEWLCRPIAQRPHHLYADYTKENEKFSYAVRISDIHNVKKSPLAHLYEDEIYPANFDKITVKGKEKIDTVLYFDKIYSAFPVISVKCDGKVHVRYESGELDGISGLGEDFVTNSDILHMSQRMHSVGFIRIIVENMSDKDACIDSVKLLYSHYPVINEGGFKCSDELINKIYNVCIHTLKICRQNTHLDSPTHQEPIACTGDYYIQALMEYMNIYDPTLTAFDIFRTAQLLEIQRGRMFHTTYSLIFPMWLYDYYLHTGKTELLKYSKRALKCLYSLFEGYVAEDNGLLEFAPDYMFVDWIVMKDAPDPYGDARDVMSHGKNEGFSLHHPPKVLGQSVLCMFYYQALMCGEKLFTVLNDEKSADKCRKNAEKLKNCINSYLYDKDKGLYIGGLNTPDRVETSSWLPKNIERTFYLKQANVLAVLYGIAPKEERAHILEYVASDLRKEEMQPYFYHFLFEALYKENLFGKYGIDLIRRYESLIEKCDKGLCEAWEYINADCSHAWGGSPAYILKKAISGLEILEAGYKKIKLSPQLYSLEYAQLEIPTPYGVIDIKLDGKGVDISAPEEIEII